MSATRSSPRASASAFDIALWDIAGKYHDEPVWKLPGGKVHDEIPVYANGWHIDERTPENYAHHAKRAVEEQEYPALKCDPFAHYEHSLADDQLGIGGVHQRVGRPFGDVATNDSELHVDVYGELDVTPRSDDFQRMLTCRTLAFVVLDVGVRFTPCPATFGTEDNVWCHFPSTSRLQTHYVWPGATRSRWFRDRPDPTLSRTDVEPGAVELDDGIRERVALLGEEVAGVDCPGCDFDGRVDGLEAHVLGAVECPAVRLLVPSDA